MKKLTFVALAAILALAIVSCDNFPLPGDDDIPNVAYAKDGSSVTFRLDGGGVTSQEDTRALSKNFAIAGMEFFEVVFTNGTNIARAAWGLGSNVSISGVPRGADTTAGISYAGVDPTVSLSPGSLGTAGTGAAVLFAGRKDGTLLAVGKVEKVNGASVALVNEESITVTFGLAALTGNVSTLVLSNSGTDSADISAKYKSYSAFPAKAIRAGATVTATYTLDSSAGTFPIADIVKAFGTTLGLVGTVTTKFYIPRYELPGGGYEEIPGQLQVPTATCTTQLGSSGSIVFSIATVADSSGVTSFTFDIPVQAMIATVSTQVPPVAAQEWHIRPGFKSGYLDVGAAGIGGVGEAALIYIANALPTGTVTFGDGLTIIPQY